MTIDELAVASAPEVFDPAETAATLQSGIRQALRDLGRRGVVVAVSGGVDSGVVAALCAAALGPDRVLCLRLPEDPRGGHSSDLGLQLARYLDTPTHEQFIGPALEALGCYEQQHQAVRLVFPDYEPGWPYKIVRSQPSGGIIVFSLVVQRPGGDQEVRRMSADAYRLLISATNAKQRIRTLISYTWADRLYAAVAGTPNLLEYDQGFFVKGGDGLADLKPIAGLYKQQVYALAQHLGLPEGIARRSPTTETFSLEQSQEEFYFGRPLDHMDDLLWGERNDIPPLAVAARTGLSQADVEAGYREVSRRRDATAYLHRPAILVGESVRT